MSSYKAIIILTNLNICSTVRWREKNTKILIASLLLGFIQIIISIGTEPVNSTGYHFSPKELSFT